MKHFISPGFLVCLVFITLVGCVSHTNMMTSTPSQLKITTTRIPVSPTSVIPLTATPTPTSTPTIVFQPTNTLTSSATAIPEETCPERKIGLQPDFLSPGIIMFIEYGRFTDPDQLYRLSTQEKKIQPFMEDLTPGTFNYFRVSPDGKWLTFRQERLENQKYIHDLYLTNSNFLERMKVSWDESNWAGLGNWLADSQHLLIVPRYDPDTRRRDEIIVFNPFTNQQQRVMPSFTYPEGTFVFDHWGAVGNDVVYDPTMTRVVYLEDNDTMVLWDIENEIELWRFADPLLMQSKIPAWSPDGSLLTVSEFVGDLLGNLDDEVFYIHLISRDGDEVWRSEPYPYYDQWWQSMVFHWSPDSRYLVFRWWVPEDEEQRTFVLDTTTMEVLDYCINGTYPIWSPDSKQFIMKEIIPDTSSDGEETYQNVLVDVEKDIVVQLDDIIFRPVAWILNEP